MVSPAGVKTASSSRSSERPAEDPPRIEVHQQSPWSRPAWRYGFLILVAALVVSADQVTKALVKSGMRLGEVIPVVPPVLDLHYITNRGVAFGMFTRFGDVFVPVAIVIMGVILWYYRSLAGRRLWLRVALSMQLGGALGNLVDRLRYGSVVDFVEFHIDAINFHFAVFNVADSAIVIGVGILLACLLLQPDADGSAAAQHEVPS